MNKFILLASLLFSASAYAEDNVVIVFDTSGSMADKMSSDRSKTRMQVAQSSLIKVLSNVPDTTKIGILTFTGWIYPISNVDHNNIKKAIKGCNPESNTPIYESIKIGATELLKHRESQNNAGSYKIVVVTDGIASDPSLNQDGIFFDGSFKPGVLKDVMNRGITIDVIGLDMEQDNPLRHQINGSYIYGDNENNLTSAISKAVAEVGFNQNPNLIEESFAEINQLPDDFVSSVIQGLSKFDNHPIGELIIKTTVGSNDSAQQPIEIEESSGSYGLYTMLIPLFATSIFFFTIYCKFFKD